MNAKQFFDLVAQMRQAQKNYFKTRDTVLLQQSKLLEKQVDAEIDRVNQRVYGQQELFPQF